MVTNRGLVGMAAEDEIAAGIRALADLACPGVVKAQSADAGESHACQLGRHWQMARGRCPNRPIPHAITAVFRVKTLLAEVKS